MTLKSVPAWAKKRADGLNIEAGLKHGFRSGLEEDNADIIKSHGEPVLFETFKIPYTIPMTFHNYTPDFILRNGIIVETKGIFDAQDRAKHIYVRSQHPNLDIRLVFTRSKAKISPGAKSTLADWCNQHGFKFADKSIPSSWFSEPGPGFDPREYVKELQVDGRRTPARAAR